MFGSARNSRIAALAAAVSVLLTACGGGSGGSDAPAAPPTRQEAGRFLTQSSFGPTESEVDHVVALGYSGWINEQVTKPQTATSHRAAWDVRDAEIRAAGLAQTPPDAGKKAGTTEVLNTFYRQAISSDDQLRQRVAFALSQIFVISMNDSSVADNGRGVASAYE